MRTPWVILLCILCLCIGGCVGCIGGMAINLQSLSESMTPQDVDVSVNAPASVKAGETFTITIVVTDLSGSGRRIHDIDVQSTLLAGMTITGIAPRPSKTENMFGYAVHTMGASVPGSGQTSVVFTLTAGSPGTYTGDIDTYIDSDLAFTTNTVTIDVTP